MWFGELITKNLTNRTERAPGQRIPGAQPTTL